MAGVVLESLSRVYPGGVAAVRHLDLEVNDGELLALVGPSGCGKSTTLRMIAGLEEVSSGQVRLGGRVVNDVAPRDRNIAMVFQNEALYPHRSVYENVAFGWRLRGRTGWRRGQPESDRAFDGRVREVAGLLGLSDLLERRPWQLSGGERQRVALGRALVREPDLLLLDEPLAHLDAQWRVELRRELKRFQAQRRTTTIYVTHDQVEALSVGDRIAVLRSGVLQQLGTPCDVYEGPRNRFVAGFVGSPPMSFAEVLVVPAEGRVSVRCDSHEWLLPDEVGQRLRQYNGKKVICGIRPEDVRIEPNETSGERSAGHAVQGRVGLVEQLGDAAVVYVDLKETQQSGNVNIAGRVEARTKLRAGDAARVELNLRRAHWFDAATDERV